MSDSGDLAEAFRLLQLGRPDEAVNLARVLTERDFRDARAHLALGIALRAQGELAAAGTALRQAAALAPRDYAPAFELGITLEQAGDAGQALAWHERAIQLRPDFTPARYCAARLLAEAGRGDEALARLEPALRARPGDPVGLHEKGWVLHRMGNASAALEPLRAAARAAPERSAWRLDLAKALADTGDDAAARAEYEDAIANGADPARSRVELARFCVSRGDYARAAALFSEALARSPDDEALPIYLAQAELLQGRWHAGWRAYARRAPRRAFEAARAALGLSYELPPIALLSGSDVMLLGEQGLGDVLFYLRFAPKLAAHGARLHFTGDRRLLSMLRRCLPLAVAREGEAASEAGAAIPILVGDLPALPGMEELPAPLALAPEAQRVQAWHERLRGFGPRPWVGVTWRAGVRQEALPHALQKHVPLDAVLRAVAPLGGTVIALQRAARPDEIQAAARILAGPVLDLGSAHEDLEDMLAIVSLLDRHVCVSNTNVHLAAGAGSRVDVLVPFPPEWRWGTAGASPWFAAFRVHRQRANGSWSEALAALAS